MSGRYIKVDFTSNWGDALVCPVEMQCCDAEGNKYNTPDMPHTVNGGTVNGTPQELSDGNAGTYWQSNASAMPNWWKVDLGESRNIPIFKMQALIAERAIRNFTVSVSMNDIDWTVILTGEGTATTDIQSWDTTDIVQQYLGVRGRDRMRTKGISLGEKTLSDGSYSFLIARHDRLRTTGISMEEANVFVPPFSPASIDGLLLWVSADEITDKSDGDSVSSWDDLSGDNNHMVQATGTLQPLYKTGIVNSLPALLFDGTDDFLQSPSLTGVKTVAVVAKYNSATFDHGYGGLITGATSDIWMLGNSGGDDWYTGESSGMTWYKDGAVSSTDLTNAWHCFIATYPTGKNQVIQTGRDRNHGGWQWYGYVAEIIAYDNVLSEDDRTLLDAYLRAKYAIA